MAQRGNRFPVFSQFPPEIRQLIWQTCLPFRVVELDYPVDNPDSVVCHRNANITATNKSPPVISRVCHESREVARRARRPLLVQGSPDVQDAEDFVQHMVLDPWIDPLRDSIHLNWDLTADIEYQTYNMGNPLRCVLYHARHQARSREPSIMLGVLQNMIGRSDPEERGHTERWTRTQLVELLCSEPSWTVVIETEEPLIVHSSIEAAAGLFGLLADARVQIVHLNDQDRLHQFLSLDESLKAFLPSIEEAQNDLQQGMDAVFKQHECPPAIHLAVMFRFCTAGCTNSGTMPGLAHLY